MPTVGRRRDNLHMLTKQFKHIGDKSQVIADNIGNYP